MSFTISDTERSVHAARFGMTEAEYVITKARNNIILSDPYFATLIMSLVCEASCGVETMATNGVLIKYNPEFVKSLTLDEAKGVLAHEALHCALLHHLRRDNREPVRWNVACDYVVNEVLISSGYTLPDGVLVDSHYNGMGVEDVYNRLGASNKPSIPNSGAGQRSGQVNSGGSSGQGNNRDNRQRGSDGAKGPGTQGSIQQHVSNPQMDIHSASGGSSGQGLRTDDAIDAPRWGLVEDYDPHNSEITGEKPTPTEIAQNAIEWGIHNTLAQKAAKNMGKGIGGALNRLLDEVHSPKVSWKEVIARFVEEVSRNDYTWQRPNPRYLQRGIVMPSLLSKTYGQILIVADTSGSVSNSEISSMVSEVLSIIEIYDSEKSGVQLPVLYCDNAVRKLEWLGMDDEPNPVGGRGTDFRPVFTWLRQHGEDENIEPRAVIYLTDGECNRFPLIEDVDIPVVWCLTTKNYGFNPPFGEVTSLEQ